MCISVYLQKGDIYLRRRRPESVQLWLDVRVRGHEGAHHVGADGEALAELPLPGQRDLPAGLLDGDQELPLESRHLALQVMDILLQCDVLLSEGIKLGFGVALFRFPVLPTPSGGFVVEVSHPLVFEG